MVSTVTLFFSPRAECPCNICINIPHLFYECSQYGVMQKCEMCRHWLSFCQLQTSTTLNWWSWRVSWSPKVSGWRCSQEGHWSPSWPQQSSPSLDKMAGGEWGWSNTGSPDPVHGESIQLSNYQWHQRWATEESTVYLILKKNKKQFSGTNVWKVFWVCFWGSLG